MIAAAGIVVLILLGGGFLLLNKSKSTNVPNAAVSPKPTEGNVFSSIKDALTRSLSLECSFTTPSGVQTKAYIKNGKVRSDVTGKTPNETGSAIIMDKKMYFWNAQTAIMMELPDVSVTPAAGQDKVAGTQSTLTSLEQYKSYCHAATISDSLFVLPTGVKFQNMSSMMKNMMPSGTPSGAVPSNYQQMMQNATPSPAQ